MIATNLKSFEYKDEGAYLLNSEINHYYKVEAVSLDTGEKKMSSIYGEYKAGHQDVYAQSLIYQYKVYPENINNNKLALLKKRRFGTLCSCYDDIRGKSNTSNCHLCYNTKYAGGYYLPELILASFLNTAMTNRVFTITDDGEEPSPIQLWSLPYPRIQNDDIIADENNIRYIVTNWQPHIKNGFMIRQTFQIQKLPKTNVIYTIPVNIL
jgi:hypothetical protein